MEAEAEARWKRHFVEQHGLTRDEFMYQRKGPWPQPAPDSPLGMAAEVLHPPRQDQWKWTRTTQLNYVREMAVQFPAGLWRWWIRHPTIEDLADDEVARQMTASSYSKFLRRREPAELDETIFHGRLHPFGEDREWFISDFTTMTLVQPKPGIFIAPTISLFSRKRDSKVKPKPACKLRAIAIGHTDDLDPHLDPADRHWKYVVLTPENGNAWRLAKYFVIQGAGHMICLNGHPASHFPYDTINAVTASALPKKHILFQLLWPHLDLHLSVNHAVLEGKNSIVSQTRGEFYAPFAGDGKGVRALVKTGFWGHDAPAALARDPHKPQPVNYGRWTYPMGPPDIPSDYGRVLKAYYQTVQRFVAAVVACIAKNLNEHEGKKCEEEDYIRLWADFIAQWLPGFPDGRTILERGRGDDHFPKLTRAVTTFIWDVAIAHSLEHATFNRLGPYKTSFRLRVPPPRSTDAPKYELRELVHGRDLFKSNLAFHMFFKPHVVKRLVDVDYGWNIPELVAAVEHFHADLEATERQLMAEQIDIDDYICYLDLSSSIQY